MWEVIINNFLISLFFILFITIHFYFIYISLDNPFEEPFSLTEGVSVWPTLIIRTIALVLTWIFFFISLASLRKSNDEIALEFRLGNWQEVVKKNQGKFQDISLSDLQVGRLEGGDSFKRPKDWHIKGPHRNIAPGKKGKLLNIWTRFCDRVKKFYEIIRYNWEFDEHDDNVNMSNLWEEYVRRGGWYFLLMRIIPIFIIYYILFSLIISAIGMPNPPVRGYISHFLYQWILVITVISWFFLTIFVYDSTSITRRFVTLTFTKKYQWPKETIERFVLKIGLSGEELSDLMLVRLVAKRTEVVGKLIFFPFIILFLIFVSGLNYFDNFGAPIALAIVIILNAVFAWSCTLMLRHSAEKERAALIDRLSMDLVKVYADENISQKHKERLEFVLNEVKSIKQGAFAPFFQQPVLHSLYVSLGGIGGLALLEYFLK
jgi:hypothetical protein